MTEKTPDPNPAIDSDAIAEEVVLASTPTTPTHLAIDDNELVGVDAHGDVEESAGHAATGGPFERLLSALRQPEQCLAAAYTHSGIHRILRERFEWYRDMEDNRVLGETLVDTYNAKPGGRLHSFVRNNVLCSVLGLAAFGLVTQQGLDYAFDRGGGKRQQVAKSEKKPKARKAVKAAAPQQTLAELLQHCIVTPSARQTLDGANRDVSQAAMFEIKRFRNRYEESGIERQYRDAIQKSISIERASQALISATRDYAAQLENRHRTLQQQQSAFRNRLKQTRLGDNADPVATVNQRIQLRNELTRIDDIIAGGPSRRAYDELATALQRLEHVLASETGAAPILNEHNWLLEAEQMSAEALAQNLDATLSNDVLEPIASYADASLAIQRYRLQVITDTVSRFSDLLSFYVARPKELFHQLDREQVRVNQRLATLIGDPPDTEGVALDISGCLDQVDQVRAADNELPAAGKPPST